MEDRVPDYYKDVEKCVDGVIEKVGKKIVLGIPLALGKPNQFVNALYRRIKHDPSMHLTICTALSLERPRGSSDLEKRFLNPFVKRMFDGYVDLDYMKDLRSGLLPPNFELREFYAKAGSYLKEDSAQQNYVSSNYTHAWRDIRDSGVNVIAQMVSKKDVNGEPCFSMSCNPEITLDLAPALRELEKEGYKMAAIAQVNQNLPFMYGDAVVKPGYFDMVIDSPKYNTRLFGAPKMSITTPDYMIGLYASALIKDGGTLQIGIGSLGDALCRGLIMREKNNRDYNRFLKDAGIIDRFGDVINRIGGTGTFDEGITGSTEMLVDGYLHLIDNGVVKRNVYESIPLQRLLNAGRINQDVTPKTLELLLAEKAINPVLTREDFDFLVRFGIFKDGLEFRDGTIRCKEAPGGNPIDIPANLGDAAGMARITSHCLGKSLKNGILIYGGFFLGPESFYARLRNMSEQDREKIYMTSVLNVNQLYSNYLSEELKTLHRRHGRFVNACLKVTLSGGVVSDGLEDGKVVSGVGGQYNFVSQAHAIPGARSIIMCKGLRGSGRDQASNIVFNYGHITIPRHLRDIVITEYGIADLRGKSDSEIIKALLNITDSRFQDDLLQKAKDAGKISVGYVIEEKHRNNLPERLDEQMARYRKAGFFEPFPFGTDFTDEELVIGKALKGLKLQMSEGMSRVTSLGKAISIRRFPDSATPYLERLALANPKSAREKMMAKLVVYALRQQGSV
jgi:acyl-CoA hydrolase